MKKDKYPLGGPLGMAPDPNRPGSATLTRDMYSAAAGMNGYMPNGYHGYDGSSMYNQSPYSSNPMSSSSPSSLYSRYDMSGMYSPSSTPSAMSYMNGSYMSMYGSAGGGSPYGLQGGPMSPGGSQSGGDVGGGLTGINHPSHSPGSVKSEAGGSGGPPTSVSMGSGSPGSLPPGSTSAGGPPLSNVKREPTSIPPPLGSGPGSVGPPSQSLPPGPGGHPGGPPPHAGGHELSSLISMYLPGDAAAAAAGDTGAQSRIQSLSQQMYGHYGLHMGSHHPHGPAESMGLAPTSPYPV